MGPSQRMYHLRGAASDQKADEKELVERAAGDLFLKVTSPECQRDFQVLNCGPSSEFLHIAYHYLISSVFSLAWKNICLTTGAGSRGVFAEGGSVSSLS